MKQRDIYIVSQDGLDPEVNYVAVEAISEIMGFFPEYKNDYPITNLGAWKDHGYIYSQNGKLYLAPYKSTRWHIENARPDPNYHRLNASTLLETMQKDPTNQQIPQFTILLTKDDLYPYDKDAYCLGIGEERIGCVVSAYRFSNQNGKLIDRENFKTVLMHEFGHVINLTYERRKNSEENLGPHCTDPDEMCIMQQRSDGDFSDITRARLLAKKHNISPFCPDCMTAGNEFFKEERQQWYQDKITKEALKSLVKKYGINLR